MTARPVVIFVAGIEGSGHHGLVPVLRKLKHMQYFEPAEALFTNFWDPTVPIVERLKIRSKLIEHLNDKYTKCVESPAPVSLPQAEPKCSHFMFMGRWNFFSYPYDSPRAPLRHPDLLELVSLLEDPGLRTQFDLRILVLHRDPYKTVQSGFRRGFLNDKRCLQETIRGKRITWKQKCDAVNYLAREAEMSTTFLAAELGALSHEYFRIVEFTQLTHQPADYVGAIARFLTMPASMAAELGSELPRVFGKGQKKYPRPLFNNATDAYLRGLFTASRALRWPILSEGRFELQVLDKLPRGGREDATGAAAGGPVCLEQ